MKKMLKIALVLCLAGLLAPGCNQGAISRRDATTSGQVTGEPRVVLVEMFTGDW